MKEQYFNFLNISILSTISTTCLVFLIISIGNIFFNNKNKIIDVLIELSYPIYIFHLVPCIIFGIIMLEMGFNELEMILPNILLSGFSRILLYLIFARYTPLNWIINGYSKSKFSLKK